MYDFLHPHAFGQTDMFHWLLNSANAALKSVDYVSNVSDVHALIVEMGWGHCLIGD